LERVEHQSIRSSEPCLLDAEEERPWCPTK
jgi:hypothetical protein